MTTPRIYDAILTEHLGNHRQMAFVSGPRQVGKTTTCRLRTDAYLNWDDLDDRETILAGPKRVAEVIELDRLRAETPVVKLKSGPCSDLPTGTLPLRSGLPASASEPRPFRRSSRRIVDRHPL